jgi:hypothetical protein
LPGSLRKSLWIAGFVLVPPLAAWLVFYAVGSWRLAEALSAARQAGHATTLAELAPPPLPAERNAAVHFQAAFALHPDAGEGEPALARGIEVGFKGLSEAERKTALELLKGATGMFQRIRAGRALGSCRYDRDYTRLYDRSLPWVRDSIRAARLLKLRAESEIAAGRGEEARETVRDLLALADSYRSEPIMITQLVRLVLVNLALELVHEAVSEGTSGSDLRAWLEIVPAPSTLDGALQGAYRGELAMGAELAGRSLGEAVSRVGDSAAPQPWLSRTDLLAPYWKILGSNYLRRMIPLVEASGGPYLEARARFESADEELKASTFYGDLLSRLLIPALVKPMNHLARTQAAMAVVRTGLEWEIERAARGRYPQETAVPDPLTGAPLRFDPEAGRISSTGSPGMTAEDLEESRMVWRLRHPPGRQADRGR